MTTSVALPTDATAIWLGITYGRYSLADRSVRGALRRLHSSNLKPGQRRRSFSVARLRSKANADTAVVSGIASAYGRPYEIGDGLQEIIRPFAFAESLAAKPTVALYLEHDWSQPIGIATCHETQEALHFEAEIWTDTDRAKAAYRTVEAHGLDGVSVGFIADEVFYDKQNRIDEIVRATLLEVSIVLRPANAAALVQSVVGSK